MYTRVYLIVQNNACNCIPEQVAYINERTICFVFGSRNFINVGGGMRDMLFLYSLSTYLRVLKSFITEDKYLALRQGSLV
jgi:hypothetical protein